MSAASPIHFNTLPAMPATPPPFSRSAPILHFTAIPARRQPPPRAGTAGGRLPVEEEPLGGRGDLVGADIPLRDDEAFQDHVIHVGGGEDI